MALSMNLSTVWDNLAYSCKADRLSSSILSGKTDNLEKRIAHCSDISADGVRPVQSAILMRDIDSLHDLISAKAPINGMSDENWFSPLELALLLNFPQGAAMLVDHGADISETMSEGCSPFHKALLLTVGFSDKPMQNHVITSISNGIYNAHSKELDFEVCTYLKTARRIDYEARPYVNMVESFINRKVDLNKHDKTFGITPLETVAYGQEQSDLLVEVFSMLVRGKAEVTDKFVKLAEAQHGKGWFASRVQSEKKFQDSYRKTREYKRSRNETNRRPS